MVAQPRSVDFGPVPDLAGQHGIGVLAPFDFALDRELWRWLPAEVGHACTSAGFVAGAAGERELRADITGAGAPAAVTTSGALVTALAELGARRIAVLTPCLDSVTERLHGFLAEHGVAVTASLGLGLSARIWRLTHADVLAAASAIDLTGADALFISCTNVPTYDIIAPLEQLLGLPVLTANQVTMWAALRELGLAAVGPGQHLIEAGAELGAAA